MPLKMFSAIFGPMPETVWTSSRNKSRSAAVMKPYNVCASSRMTSCVSSFTVPARLRQLVERRQRNERLIADAVDIHDDLRGQRLDEFAVEKSDHALNATL